MDAKGRYLNLLKSKLEAYYLKVRDYDEKPPIQAKEIEAFMEAGVALQAVSKKELESVILELHHTIFGVGLDERRQQETLTNLEGGDFSYFDTPAWIRAKK